MSSLKFENLHHHTVFSFNDGLGYPEDHAKELANIGCEYFSVTDHGNMCGFVYQHEACKKYGLKPIYGMEGYFIDSISQWRDDYEQHALENKIKKAEKRITATFVDEEKKLKASTKIYRKAHILLLAKNQTGLTNLFQIITKSNRRENFYMKPRLDFKMLKKHSEGLVVSSACIGGILADTIHNGLHNELSNIQIVDELCDYIQRFVDIFGEDFYCELMFNKIPFQHVMNWFLIQSAMECGVELVTTTDVHYPRQDLWESRELYRKIAFSKGKKFSEEEGLPRYDELQCELYPRNGESIWNDYLEFSQYAEFDYDDDIVARSIENSSYIANNVIEQFQIDVENKLPHFVLDSDIDEDEELKKLCYESLWKKGKERSKEYKERLNYELEIIKGNDFSSYFLITKKIVVDIGSKHMLVGPARGSAGGSLVAYLLGITQIDPIRFDLIFERFMSKNQTGLPDIDVDFADRKELVNILIDKWGENSVVPISNLNTLQTRSLLKDVSKFYGVDYGEVNDVTTVMEKEAIPHVKKELGIKSGEVNITFKELRKYSQSMIAYLEKYPHIEKHVDALFGSIRSFSRHAGGVLILEDLHKKMPLCRTQDGFQTPWTGGDNVKFLEPMLQKLGFIKFDLLGLNTLSLITNCISKILKTDDFEDIKNFYDDKLHPDVIDLNDDKVWEHVFRNGNFVGVFQFTQRGVQSFCNESEPEKLDELSMITSIYRPGPLSANVDKTYVQAKDNPDNVVYEHPIIQEILSKSYGHIVFQEDLAMIAHKMGKNISLDEGNKFRKILIKRGKKGITDDDRDEDIYNRFIEGCVEKGLKKEQALEILNRMEFFSKYGFNKAHATAYSIISYQCAYMSYYYPYEWCAAFLDKETVAGNKPFQKEFAINLVKKFGIQIERADINKSDGYSWIPKDGEIVQPLSSIKGLADASIEQIVENRPFNNIDEVFYNSDISYTKLNIGKLRTLVLSGILNELAKVDDRFDNLMHLYLSTFNEKGSKPPTLEDFNMAADVNKGCANFTHKEKIQNIIELTSVFPLDMLLSDEIKEGLENNSIPPISEYDPMMHTHAWFICRGTELKKTKNGKHYFMVKCIDDAATNKILRIWGVNPKTDKIYQNSLYIVRVKDYNPRFGYSALGVKNVRILR